jgi:hypothetical protein
VGTVEKLIRKEEFFPRLFSSLLEFASWAKDKMQDKRKMEVHKMFFIVRIISA